MIHKVTKQGLSAAEFPEVGKIYGENQHWNTKCISVSWMLEYIDKWASREILMVEGMPWNGTPEELHLLCLLKV